MKDFPKKNNSISKEKVTPTINITTLQIIEEALRKTYLTRLTEMHVAPIQSPGQLEDDLIDNIRLYHITEMVYPKGESISDKLTTIYNTISTYKAAVFLILDSDGMKTDFYIGVRNNERDEREKRSTVTLGDTLKNTLIGHFPGIKIQDEDRLQIAQLASRIQSQRNVSAVSVSASCKDSAKRRDDDFVQGLEKLVLAMNGRQYVGILIAENQTPQTVNILRSGYQTLYTKLSPLQKIQISAGTSESTASRLSFAEMSSKQKAATLGGALAAVGAAAIGGIIGANVGGDEGGLHGAIIGNQIAGQMNSFINALAPVPEHTTGENHSVSTTSENRAVTSLLSMIDNALIRLDAFDSYGMWQVAGYFVSDDMAAAEIAASNYRSLMSGEQSGREVSAINSWRYDDSSNAQEFMDLTLYLSRFSHPQFLYMDSKECSVLTNATTAISGKELGLYLGLPRAAVPGLPVIVHAEFGKEVYSYQATDIGRKRSPEDWMTLGKVFDLGQTTNKDVELDNKSLSMHTFITGATGSGKSNAVYHILDELHQDEIPFLVVESAKGEYKKVFGSRKDVSVYGTNPYLSPMLRLNPFSFPKGIHVFEHLDRLVEIFNVCWPMYAAMPAVLKSAIEKAYEDCGWNLRTSVNKYGEELYPTFADVARNIRNIIDSSDYDADNKGAYKGSLLTRLQSMTNGINGTIFVIDEIPAAELFDRNVIVDLSRVGSAETKSLLMGILVLKLQEYRMACDGPMNAALRHITVLEEAHNLLKRSSQSVSPDSANLLGKSVEMIANAIAEMRTYGEGFIIVDQAPGLLDMAAIRNTNTKIIMRLPDQSDRDLVGRAANLNDDQIIELAKLPCGVAAVYQNEWVQPVLCKIDQYETPIESYSYEPENNAITDNETELASESLLSCIMNKELYLRGDRTDMLALKHIVLQSGIDSLVKRDFLEYLGSDDQRQLAALSQLIYHFLSADEAIRTAERCTEIRDWTHTVVDSLNPPIKDYSSIQKDRVITLILDEQTARDDSYNDLFRRFIEIYQSEGGVY